jgi:hypothetical protein
VESTGVFLAGNNSNDEEQLEEAANLLALILAQHRIPRRQYRLRDHHLVEASGYGGRETEL